MSTGTGRGPYAKTAATKLRIIESCIEAFAETGFYGTTMKDIARRAGISYTGLLHHFPKKEDLLLAVLELRAHRDEEFLARTGGLNAGTDPLGVLHGMLEVARGNTLKPGLLELHAVVSGEATSAEHPAHGHYVAHYRDLRQFYAAAYSSLRERGLLESSATPETLATMTVSLINGLQAQWLFDRQSVDVPETLRQFLVDIVPSLRPSATHERP
ncbi:TetR/AcrR family transcriptional regulator [Sinomonas sp. G460-2]|uniref:TetR/AcrR family transcriptional regulator n=1 Tax=Sinomonas sp. G460-2 TaxID=3393464 RepID=UPI0039F09280